MPRTRIPRSHKPSPLLSGPEILPPPILTFTEDDLKEFAAENHSHRINEPCTNLCWYYHCLELKPDDVPDSLWWYFVIQSDWKRSEWTHNL